MEMEPERVVSLVRIARAMPAAFRGEIHEAADCSARNRGLGVRKTTSAAGAAAEVFIVIGAGSILAFTLINYATSIQELLPA